MDSTTIKSVQKTKQVDNEIVLQITRQQLVNFFRAVLVLGILSINFLAFQVDSALLPQLLISQAIIALIVLIKSMNFNKVIKS